MAERLIGWNRVVGPIYAPNGNGAVTVPARTEFDRTLLNHLNQQMGDSEFHVAEPVTLLASAVRQTITDFEVRPQHLGWLKGFANGVAMLADYDLIRWSLLVDDTPVLGFDNIIGPFGVFIYPKPVMVPLYPASVVRLVASNLGAVDIPLVTGYLMGYTFPMDAEGV